MAGRDDIPEDLDFQEDPGLTEGQAMELIMFAAESLGWVLLIPNVDDDEELPGVIMGSNDYVEWISKQLTDGTMPESLRKKIKQLCEHAHLDTMITYKTKDHKKNISTRNLMSTGDNYALSKCPPHKRMRGVPIDDLGRNQHPKSMGLSKIPLDGRLRGHKKSCRKGN